MVARDPTAIGSWCEEHFLQADLNEAAVRRTRSRVPGPTFEVAGVAWCAEKEGSL
jgi:hypothetical protein